MNTYMVFIFICMPYTVQGRPLLLVLSAALTIIGLDVLATVGDTVSCLFLEGVCNAFYSSHNLTMKSLLNLTKKKMSNLSLTF